MEIQNITETGKNIMGCHPDIASQTLGSSHFLIPFRAALVLFLLTLKSKKKKKKSYKLLRVEKMTYGS